MRRLVESQIRSCAHELIGRHGPDAGTHASRNADRCLAESNIEGAATWLNIARRIEGLLARSQR